MRGLEISFTPRRRGGVIACVAVAALISSISIVGCTNTTDLESESVVTKSTTQSMTEPSDQDCESAQAQALKFPSDQPFIDNVQLLNMYKMSEGDAENALDNAPRRYTDRFGFVVQPVPSDPMGWNNSYMDADNRGCTSCHSLEDALMNLPTYHRLIFMGYPTEQTYANCITCHSWSPDALQSTIHSIHMSSTSFNDMNGSCQSCHFIDEDGAYLRWDYEKYDHLKGITDVASKEADMDVTYDQDTITPLNQQFYKTIKTEPSQWLTDDSNIDPSIYENWTIKVTGAVDNPFEMTLPEMVEKFGLDHEIMKNDCCVNGVGNATIFQAEVDGIPLTSIMDYAQPQADANCYRAIGDDGYQYGIPLNYALENKAMIVTKVNNETLRPTQGYPCASWMNKASGGDFTKKVVEISIEALPSDQYPFELYTGTFDDPMTGEPASKPNSGVLNYPNGVVLQDQAGKPVKLEGFADAWDEPITKVEFSLDHGTTWETLDIAKPNSDRWVYWRLSYTPPEAGAYLLEIRTTCTKTDGDDRVSVWPTEFLFNVE